MHRPSYLLLAAFLAVMASGCAGMRAGGGPGGEEAGNVPLVFSGGLDVAAESGRRWTGVAVSKEGRMFVCWPRWSDDVPVSVAELLPSGEAVPYPDAAWNAWDERMSPRSGFVCAQSVYVDAENFLWILDPANPKFAGVIEGGPKLVKVDLATNRIAAKYYFDEYAAPPGSYLNDVRVDTAGGFAYITDSGLGAIVVVNLASGKSRRVLEFNESSKSEGASVVIDGEAWLRDGKKPAVHSDGIALSPDGEYLYYHALTGTSLYRIGTVWLRDVLLTSRKRGGHVELVGTTGPADGMMFGPDGLLYITSLEESAIKRLMPEGGLETVVEDGRLAWPDSLAFGPDGSLYVTASRIHLWGETTEPYRLFRLSP